MVKKAPNDTVIDRGLVFYLTGFGDETSLVDNYF